MKMISTPAAVGIGQYTSYVHNCIRNPACEPPYAAPLPAVPYLQLYVDFGQYQPVLYEIRLQDVCNVGHQEQIFPSNYVVGQSPEGNWYGVFKYFSSPVYAVTSFVVWMSALVDTPAGIVEKTFFSEMLMLDPCGHLTKVKSCQPANATTTGFDVNGVYYGLPAEGLVLGFDNLRYFHIAYVRNAKVREMSNKATFSSSLVRNFRTTVEKIYQLETELVPKWYKDVLLAIYARGAIQIDEGRTYLVSDLNFEALNDDDILWRPYPQMKDTINLYFGCDESDCVECCSPVIISADMVSDGNDSVPPDESTSASASPGGSVTPPGSIHVNATLCDSTEECCTNGDTLVWIADTETDIAPGVSVWMNPGMTIPASGPFIKNSGGTIYNMSGGVVGSSTGLTC
jgi:hypothetical protein